MVTTNRVAYDTDGRPIEYGAHRYPAGSYSLEMTLTQL